MHNKTPDYIVIGSGSAGSAITKRLSDANFQVSVLEFGGSDKSMLIQMPAALSYPMNMPRYDWGFVSEPEIHLAGRRMACPRGKVVGGSSSINGMVYVRGHAGDYNYWAESGAQGWAYADVLPYFKRMESAHAGDEGWRGRTGPLHVRRGKMANPLYQAFIQAAHAVGYPLTNDYNGYQQEGFGAMEMTVWNGERFSAAKAYLRPALKDGRVQLLTRALAQRVLFDGMRAIGVEFLWRGKVQKLKANKGVIIAASAINSPKLLMLSGIGKGEDLQALGLPVLLNRRAVGENLQDHLDFYFQMQCLQPISLSRYLNPIGKAYTGLRWLFNRSGPGASNHFEAAGFIRSRADVQYPDIQYHFLPIAVRYDGKSAARSHGFQAHVAPMRSPSRGRVSLRSKDPVTPPKVQFNYMSHPQDWQDFRTCIRLTREIFTAPPMQKFAGEEIAPSASRQSDSELDDYIRMHVESAYHPCGTCKMGADDDPHSVVDNQCRVIGVENLWVADSSIFPRITNGNLNAPSIMSGEKAADHILGKTPLAADNAAHWEHPQWQTKQR